MPDRIPQLDDLAATAKESPMLSPSEIRRRGDRRRAGRRTVGAVAAALALAVGGVTVWNSPLLDDARDPAPVPLLDLLGRPALDRSAKGIAHGGSCDDGDATVLQPAHNVLLLHEGGSGRSPEGDRPMVG